MTKFIRWLGSALLALCACMGAGPVVAQDLKFSVPLPLTGVLAFTGQLQQSAWQHAVDYINKTGGIKGRKIDLSLYDDEYKVDLGVAGFKKAVASGDIVFAAGDGTPFIRAISPENNDRYKVLMSSTGMASDLVDGAKYPYHFLAALNYTDMFDVLFSYIKGKQGSGPAPKVALVYSTTEFGRDPIENAKKKAASLGINIVLEEETKFGGVEIGASAVKLRNAAADYVIFHGYAGGIWPEILKQAQVYGIKSQFMGTAFGADPELVRGVGPAADGFLGVVPYNLIVRDSNAPIMKVIDGYLRSWKAKPYTGYANMGYMQVWVTALILREAIGNVIEAKKPLTGVNLIAAVRAMKPSDFGGIYASPVAMVRQRLPAGVIYRFHVKADSFSATPEVPFARAE